MAIYAAFLLLIWSVGIAAGIASVYAGFSGHNKLAADIGMGILLYVLYVVAPGTAVLLGLIEKEK